MRIVYTNLTENDAGITRSVRQFQVDFSGTSAPSASVLKAAAVAPDETSAADRLQERLAMEAAYASEQEQITAPAEEGIGGFRSIFIRKFVAAQRTALAGRKEIVNITV